jgi:hypothetical protein
MDEDSRGVVTAIDGLASVDGPDAFCGLQELADRYFALPDAAAHLEVWFRLYERFPSSDGEGVFWTILHRIEALPGYARLVVASVRRKPAFMPVLLINRLLNGGISSVDGVDLPGLLGAVAADERCPATVREAAKGYLEYQRSVVAGKQHGAT